MTAAPPFVVQLRHELRNPVNAIVGYSQLLREEEYGDPLSDTARQDLAHIEAAGLHLSRIIGDLHPPAELQDADICDYAARLRHAIRAPVTSIQGYAEVILEEVDGTPVADDLRRIHSAAGRVVALADAVERLFMLRSEVTETAPSDACSPIADVAVAAEHPHDPASGGGVVLVIDDEEDNRTLLTRRLELQGYRVVLAEGGREGLAAAAATTVDVILLDIVLPDLSGYEVLASLKENDALKDIPVLMITALDDRASVIRCIGLGAEDYLAKPFDPLLLRARLSSCLAKKRARDFERRFLRGVSAVTSAAAAVEAGSFDPASLDEVGRRPDALGHLARLFRRMAVEVATRERRLREQVQQLTIEIDERKKNAQVAEITETDYFRGLVERARALSARPSRQSRKISS